MPICLATSLALNCISSTLTEAVALFYDVISNTLLQFQRGSRKPFRPGAHMKRRSRWSRHPRMVDSFTSRFRAAAELPMSSANKM
ncbi:unnamed protein product, partial [Ixodes pacificus]